ncbi:DUF5011 domain-containing protein [Roseovarius pacificus]|uniref:DUF5011 domain-containing protein n=1 Tax=Roseovarius pacificus TaxID=337701 RepID=UPI002A18A754|nr:DUF5011 domain-containing protein [Roseovarius pacificus]
MELTLALTAAANATYDNPNGLSAALTGPNPVVAGQMIELGLRIDAEDTTGVLALGATVVVPDGWVYKGLGTASSGSLPPIAGQNQTSGNLEFAWIDASQFPYSFNFLVTTADPLASAEISAFATYRTMSGPQYQSEVVTVNLASTDTVPPVITLIGGDIVAIEVGDTFEDPGWVATDEVDGDLSNDVAVGGSVDPSVVGDYTLTYNVSDSAGNAAIEKTRLVQVVQPGTTTKGFFLCGAETGPSAGFGDLALVLLAGIAIFGVAWRGRERVPVRVQRPKTDERNRS